MHSFKNTAVVLTIAITTMVFTTSDTSAMPQAPRVWAAPTPIVNAAQLKKRTVNHPGIYDACPAPYNGGCGGGPVSGPGGGGGGPKGTNPQPSAPRPNAWRVQN